MQIASMPVAPPPAVELLSRIKVSRRVETPEGPGAFRLDSKTVVLRDLGSREPAGYVKSTWFRTPTSGAGGGTVAFVGSSAAERVAAAAVRDALLASGLLAQEWKPGAGDIQAPGTTRLYLGIMQRHVDVDPAGPAGAVLDAIEAWYRVATSEQLPSM